jgi:predicted AlkP superfamily phosphohydrolase/phosphomutase
VEPARPEATALGLGQLARHVYQIDWTRTRAFAPLPSGNGIHIVVRDDAHPGGVPPGEYEAFRDRLAADLRGITDPESGETVVTQVWPREAIFDGPHLALAPDLTLVLQDGGLISILSSPDALRRRPFPTGTHRPDGVFVALGPGVRRGVRLDPLGILDVAPLLLRGLDLPIPAAFEGRFAAEVLDPASLAERPVARSEQALSSGPDVAEGDLDAEAEAEILRRLQELGYVE